MYTNSKSLEFSLTHCQLILRIVSKIYCFLKKKVQIGRDPGFLAQEGDWGIFQNKWYNGVKKRGHQKIYQQLEIYTYKQNSLCKS